MAKIVTHNAKFHADDVFAVATLLILFPDAEVTRTRDEGLIKAADIVVDVGDLYSPENNHFDHHQKGGAGERANGIQYASFGLVWKKFGEKICKSKEVAEKLDSILVQVIDAGDNGQDVLKPLISNVLPFAVSSVVDSYRLTWKEGENWDERFMEAVQWAQNLLGRQVKIISDALDGTKIVEKEYEKSDDKRIIQIDKNYDLGREIVMNVLVNHPEPIYAVLYRGDTQSWQVLAIRKDLTSFESRKALPELWRAKKEKDFESVSGVLGSLFCHRSGFMCTVQSKEGALALAKIALDA